MGALTPSERRVADLAAEVGQSNRDHRKLGIGSRELPGVLAAA